MSTLADECATVERASIDEAYLDVTAEVDAVLLGDPEDIAARVRLGVDASGAVAPSTSTRARSTVDWRSARTCVAARARGGVCRDRVHDERRRGAQQDVGQVGVGEE